MPKTLEGTLQAKGYKFGIVVSRFNAFITDKLLEGALDCLKERGGYGRRDHRQGPRSL